MPGSYSNPAVSGSGAIACGVAAAMTVHAPVKLLARSEASADRARVTVDRICGKVEQAVSERVEVVQDMAQLAGCDLIVEAITEDPAIKGPHLAELAEVAPDADIASTTSSLSITELGEAAGAPERFYGLHVFNPVTKMDLIELCLPDSLGGGVADRARSFCEAIGKTAIEVPDQAGFVVNRLLFPFLFDAVRLRESTGLEPDAVDACMSMGAAHPMGPLKLLDFIGLDVAKAIGESIVAETGDERDRAPAALSDLIDAGRLGRKSGAGFYEYS